jgi:hypothetical protein
MKEETYGMIWGTIVLVLGLGILLFVFSNVYEITQNPSEKLDEWVPEEIKDPTASFSWSSQDASVGFTDTSVKGSGEITSWYWEFGDGSSSNEKNPNHGYSGYGGYTVSLQVEDENSKTSSVQTRVSIEEGGSNEGQTQAGLSFDLGLDYELKRFGVVTLFLGAFAVVVMIGGRITLAGCRLLRPMPKTFKIRVKPKDMEFEIPGKQKEEIKQKIVDKTDKKSWFGKR